MSLSETGALVSCIVPVFNGEQYLREALDSIFAQTYRPIEVIVADDGSTDGSRTVAESYGGRLKCISQATAGPAAARNYGARAARGDMLAFLDADDLWKPEKLERQVSKLDERPELDACVSRVQMFWAPELGEEEALYREHPRAQAIPGYASITLLARRRAFDRIGMFREDLWFADSTDWFIRFREAGLALDVLPEVLVLHRMHATNHTRRRSEASKAEFAGVIAATLSRRPPRP
jgi:glycosyltransferase involved in cell wall biosynthesis